jgi:hypothetical protein
LELDIEFEHSRRHSVDARTPKPGTISLFRHDLFDSHAAERDAGYEIVVLQSDVAFAPALAVKFGHLLAVL